MNTRPYVCNKMFLRLVILYCYLYRVPYWMCLRCELYLNKILIAATEQGDFVYGQFAAK